MTTASLERQLNNQPGENSRLARPVVPWGLAGDIAAGLVPAFFLLVTVSLESIQVGFDPRRDTVSQLALGRYGWLLTGAFFLLGGLLIALAGRLYPTVRRSLRGVNGLAILSFVGAAFIVLGVCPTGPPGAAPTPTALVHRYTARGIAPLFALACGLLASGIGPKRPGWFRRYTLATGQAMLILTAAGAVVVFRELPWVGLVERVLLAGGLVWVEVTCLRLALARRAPPAGQKFVEHRAQPDVPRVSPDQYRYRRLSRPAYRSGSRELSLTTRGE